jgi:hypothetical protein
LTPWQSPALLLGLLEQYCAAHPDDIVERGAQELVGYLRPSALEEEAELVSIRNGQSVVLVYRPVLSRIRAALDAAGFTPGAGVTGLTTALESYQTSENLERTGLPDQRTLARLLE